MSLRSRLTFVVTAVAAVVLALSISVALNEIEDRIVGDATALELERFVDDTFTPTLDRGDAEGAAELLAIEVRDDDSPLGFDGLDEFWADELDGVEWQSEDFGYGREFVDEWFFEDDTFLSEEFAFAVTLDELDELAGLSRKLGAQDLLDTPWEWYGLPGPGESEGGLVALRDLSLLSVDVDGSLRVVLPSEGLVSLMELGVVRLPSVAGDPSASAVGEHGDELVSLFVDEFISSAYQLFGIDIDEGNLDDEFLGVGLDGGEQSNSVLLVRDELYGDESIPQLARIGAVAIEAPGLATAIDALEVVEMVLWGSAALVLAALAGITWVMTGRALAPVRAMTSRVGEISGGNLHERVPEPGSGDEIDVLARTMNGMLGRMERADGERRRFVSDASHELRSPVASMRTELEVANQFPEQADWPVVAANVATENARLETIITDLLALARFDEADPVDAVTQIDLDDLLIEEAHRPRSRSVDVSSVSAGRVEGRHSELVTVVRHLIDNAARHAVERVVVSLVTDGDSVVLTVDDDGAGIPEVDRERIFERFTRLQESRDRDSGGAGLGLAVVEAAVARHDGAVVATESPLGGARFTVTLPAAP